MKSLTTTPLHSWSVNSYIFHFQKYFIFLNVLIWGFSLPAYTQSCPSDFSEVIVGILTDEWGSETSWNLLDDNGKIYREVSSNTYGDNNSTLYLDTICVPRNICLNFTITDSANDGICCGFGNGSYEIILNDSIIGSGGMFEESELLRFYSTTDGTVCPPLEEEEVDCDDGESEVVVHILTDDWGGETRWSLEDDNGTAYGEVSFGDYASNTLYVDTICVPQNICLNFTITDSAGDGICCNAINENGFYEIILNDTIIGSGGEFGVSESLRFYSTDGTTCIDPTYPTTNLQDSLELVNFYNVTCGADCILDWDFTTYVITWEGITIEDGRVTAIDISAKNLSGNIPNLNLPKLEGLYLFFNTLNGNIPNFENLPNLQQLNIQNNTLSGSIPNFENLSELWSLDISYNMLSDSCFSDALFNLCSIGSYDFSNNPDLPGGGDFAAFCDNGFGSCIDTTFTSIDSLELVRLYNATCKGCNLDWNFDSPFHTWEGIYVVSGKVIEIDMNKKELKGSIPDSLNLPFLTSLNLSQNQLSGEIPEFNLPRLEKMYLYDNELSGEIPNFNLPNLVDIFLGLSGIGGNQLSGSIPNFDSLPNLEFLSLGENQLSGEIPNFNLPNLRVLWLGNNELNSEIPNFNLPNLEEMSLFNNQLSGEIPNFGGLPKLKDMSLGNNRLSEQIPDFMLPYLEFISLSENQLSGRVPSFQGSPQLEEIWLYKNQLSGEIPPDFSQLDSLRILYLSENQLSGPIPNFTNSKLTQLILNHNKLSGEIPDFNALTNLEILHLWVNELSGPIPDFINNTKLKELNLYFNELSGSIPDFKHLIDLEKLDLGVNDLSDTIPNFNNNAKLTRVDLHYNNLSGSIPDFSALMNLEYLGLSLNQLNDTIPNFKNIHLKQLYLSHNNLTGSIPNFDSLINLEYLGLSNNQLNGQIPHFDNLPNLKTLTLDYNEFSYNEVEDYLLNHTPTEFRYSPQYYGDIQSYIVEPNTSLKLELIPPFQSTNNNQYVSYQWEKNYSELAGSTDSTFIINDLQISNVGKYTLHIEDSSRIPDLEIISKPIYVVVPRYDLYGQPIIYNQIIMEFDSEADKMEYEEKYIDPLPIPPAIVKDSCDCNRLLYLWEFEDDSIALEVFLEVNTRREKQRRRAKVDGGLNNLLSVGPITSGLGWTWSGDYSDSYPDSVLVYLLDSGLNTEHWDASHYLLENAPLDVCYNISPAEGYDYTDSLITIRPNFTDSLGHGTYGFRSIAEELPDDMDIKIVPLKVFNKQGQGTLFDLICALYHAIDHDADIINVSAGYSGEPSEILKNAIALAQEKGQFIVTATGNDGVNIDSIPQYPAYFTVPDTLYTISEFTEQDTMIITHFDNVISVASLSPDDNLSDFSNYGQYAATMSAYGENMAGYSHTGESVSSSGSSVSAYYVTRELAAEIAKDDNRDYRQIWSDFEAERLRICPTTEGLTSTGKCLDIELEGICDACGGISNDLITDYFIFPNPTEGELFVKFALKEKVDYVSIRLFGPMGQLFLSESQNIDEEYLQLLLNMNGIPSGIYFLQIDAGGTILTHKIIKH